ncbi:MAG: polysaccharide deacetylase family protein [Bacteroidales bacterium]
MRLFRPFFLARLIYPDALFRIKTNKNEVCLTFDDGPDPGSTPGILEILGSHQVKAVFFCSGTQIEKYPELSGLITSNGHITGNHGFLHLRGWKTGAEQYIENAYMAAGFTSSGLFRPPYGSLSPFQYFKLKKSFKIVFWDLMPYDFDPVFGKERSLGILKAKMRPGSVIVLHDKPASTVLSFLEEFLDYAEGKGYRFVFPGLSGKEQ